jgi:hypothetical protein
MLGPHCSAFIPLARLAKTYAAQSKSEWCWAACISMLFGYNGHPVTQRNVVKGAYGTDANMPASHFTLMNALNRTWVDEGGNSFTVSTSHMYCPEAGDVDLTNAEMIETLKRETPILFCTSQHAMILTSMGFVQSRFGMQVSEAWVMDPWPGNGLRLLSPAEMLPSVNGGAIRMVATIALS